MRKQLPSLIVGIILVITLGLYMVGFTVRTTEVAIIKTFGKATEQDVVREPGFRWKWPSPIQQVVKYDNRIRVFNDTFEETTTGDKKNLIVTAFVGWRIAKPLRFLEANKSEKEIREELRGLVRHHKTAVIGEYNFSNFVSADPEELRFDEIEQGIRELVNAEAKAKYGVEVVALGIRKLMLPRNITNDVFERMRKTREKFAKRYRSEGEAEADQIVAEAASARDQIIAFAKRQAEAIRAEGDRRAAESLAMFKEDEWFANFLRTLDFLVATLDKNTTVFLDSAPFDMFQKGPLESKLNVPAPERLQAGTTSGDATP
ncbi:MAG: protease modulator HflC [Phycisphaerales bacterium]|nr:MAG: protease modulator HflC [Phycisphaerales bacterium]